MGIDSALAAEDYCYVRTTGRVTGRPHEIEIWFAAQGAASSADTASAGTIYILAGNRHASDWVKNGKREPLVTVRIADVTFDGRMRIVEAADEDALARRLLLAKYAPSNDGLEGWGRTALPVAIDLSPAAGE